MDRSYIVAFTVFPKGAGTFKTRFEDFDDFKRALYFYENLYTENKRFYKQIKKEELNELEEQKNV